MRRTEWKEYVDAERTEPFRKYRIRAEYGVDRAFAERHNQAPYFSVTGEIERYERGRWREDSGGCIHDRIAEHFPDLAPLIKWHLVAVGEGPMHYVANGIYWWEHAMGVRTFDHPYEWERYGSPHDAALVHFKSTIVFGALPDDVLPHEGTTPRDVREWLERRLPLLLEQFTQEIAGRE